MVGLLFQTLLILRTDFMFSSNREMTLLRLRFGILIIRDRYRTVFNLPVVQISVER